MTMGEKILNMRKARGWSQEELAEKIGVTRQAVSRWESNSAKPDADKIISICDLFGVTADYLLRDFFDVKPDTQPLEQIDGSHARKKRFTQKQIFGLILLIAGMVLMLAVIMVTIFDTDNVYYWGVLDYITHHNLWGHLAVGTVLAVIGGKMFFQKRFMDSDIMDDVKTMLGL